tara:strand:+ start:4174 stop:4362 length:189 start_codon:yes stop_codon:yes gene_type:complete
MFKNNTLTDQKATSLFSFLGFKFIFYFQMFRGLSFLKSRSNRDFEKCSAFGAKWPSIASQYG